MKKIIVILCLLVSSVFCSVKINAVADYSATITGTVVCFTGEELLEEDEQIVTISLEPSSQCSFVDTLTEGDDITSWFSDAGTFVSNRPLNLEAHVYENNESSIKVIFYGDVDENETVGKRAINVTIPADCVYYGLNTITDDIVIVNPTTANYIVKDGDFWLEYTGPWEVKGTVGEELETNTVKVQIVRTCEIGGQNEEINTNIIDTVTADLPTINGLTPSITDYDYTDMIITITYTGKPLATSDDLIHTTIPQACWTSNTEDRIVQDRDDVKFNIVEKVSNEIIEEDDDDEDENIVVFVIPKTGIE